jgi:hypothetical protein
MLTELRAGTTSTPAPTSSCSRLRRRAPHRRRRPSLHGRALGLGGRNRRGGRPGTLEVPSHGLSSSGWRPSGGPVPRHASDDDLPLRRTFRTDVLMDPTAGPRFKARSAARLERTAQHGPIFVDGAEESVRGGSAQRAAVSVGHLHEALRLRLSADARRDLTDGRGHQLGRSCRAQPCDVIGEDLHVVPLSEAAGAADRAIVVCAHGGYITETTAGALRELTLRRSETHSLT